MPSNRVTIVPVRVNDVEIKVIDQLAEMKGLSRAACLRTAALEEAKLKGIEFPPLKKKTTKG